MSPNIHNVNLQNAPPSGNCEDETFPPNESVLLLLEIHQCGKKKIEIVCQLVLVLDLILQKDLMSLQSDLRPVHGLLIKPSFVLH